MTHSRSGGAFAAGREYLGPGKEGARENRRDWDEDDAALVKITESNSAEEGVEVGTRMAMMAGSSSPRQVPLGSRSLHQHVIRKLLFLSGLSKSWKTQARLMNGCVDGQASLYYGNRVWAYIQVIKRHQEQVKRSRNDAKHDTKTCFSHRNDERNEMKLQRTSKLANASSYPPNS